MLRGLAIANVTITITNIATNRAITLKTDNIGQYAAKDLTAGKYDVTAVGNGFKTTVVKGVEIKRGQGRTRGYPARNWRLGRVLRICRSANESELTTTP